jgi:polyhydroxybutyrate depolymerase
MSNGGMMAYRLACEASDVFKAVVAVAGTDNTIECHPKKPLSILHIHAKDDDHVLFAGGAGENAFRDKSMVTEFVSVPKTIEKWVGLEHCESKPQKILEKPGAYCERYKCQSEVAIQLCVTESGKHSWPGGEKPRMGLVGGTPSKAISANDVMWDFFKSL